LEQDFKGDETVLTN